MSRHRCCTSSACTLATGTGQDWSDTLPPATWQPTGPWRDQALSTWYLEIEYVNGSAPAETYLHLVMTDGSATVPFTIGIRTQFGHVSLVLNGVTLGFRKPIPGVKRILIGVENFQFGTNPRTAALGVVGYDDSGREVLHIVHALEDLDATFYFDKATTTGNTLNIARSTLGRMAADTLPCCPLFNPSCDIASADTAPLGFTYTVTNFTYPIPAYSVDIDTDTIDPTEIIIESCINRCFDPDGYYSIHLLLNTGKLQLRWHDCGHSGGNYLVKEASFNPPLPDEDGRYRFKLCVQQHTMGHLGDAILAQIGMSRAAIMLENLPFTDMANCLSSYSFTDDVFASTPAVMLPTLHRMQPLNITHALPYDADAYLTNQRAGCPCLSAFEFPPAPAACHGYTAGEVPENSIKALLRTTKLPMLTRNPDANNAKIFYPLSLANGSVLPAIGAFRPFCWAAQAPRYEFANAWPQRNPNTAFSLGAPATFCQVAAGILCWSDYPPPPPQYFDPLRLMEGYTLEWVAYTLTAFSYAGDPTIRNADDEGQTFLVLRFRTISQDSPEMRFWYCTPSPVPYPLLRPDLNNRLPPVSSRTFTIDASGFAGYVFPIASPGPDAATYIRDALRQIGQLDFTVIFAP